MKFKRLTLAVTAGLFGLSASIYANQATSASPVISANTNVQSQAVRLDFQKFQLDNGLEVIFHLDSSDPVVAVTLAAHVGSSREKRGRTGFAHLFEHLLFLESENLGKGGLDKMSARIGGSGANGSTSRDVTNYMQTVPNDALEKMIWAEADKLGYFINTVTDPVLAKEKEVVKNEKRQRVDNRPYGHVFDVVSTNLYPASHPYSWLPIGSLEDLQAATLQDVKEFYARWYVPNNTTLVISGDFDPKQARQWVEKYFNDIPKGTEVPAQVKREVKLGKTKKLYHEDKFATVPQLTQVWPTPAKFHPDTYVLDILIKLLVDSKDAPLYNELVEKQKLTSDVALFDYRSELASELFLMVTAFDGVDLDTVHNAINQGFERFEKEQFTDADIDRIKAGLETEFYQNLSSVVGKGINLADYNLLADDPEMINKEIEFIRQVTKEDVWRVYNQYIKDKHYISASFVPQGQLPLAVEGAEKANITEEKVVMGQEASFDTSKQQSYAKTPSSFDRSVEPPYGKMPVVPVPDVVESQLSNGMRVSSIYTDEVPLVEFKIRIDGGMLFDARGKSGTANLLADMLNRGTASKKPAELEKAIKQLGSKIDIYATEQSITVNGSALARNFDATIALVSEMLLQPRWDEQEFALAKSAVQSQLQQRLSNPQAIAEQKMKEIIYPVGHPLSHSLTGDEQSVQNITLADIQAFHREKIAPQLANIHVAGAVQHEQIVKSLAKLQKSWPKSALAAPKVALPKMPQHSKVYFYDMPGAKQSTLYIAQPALLATNSDFYRAQVMNYILGGGSFASRLTQQLREGKGYTYGIGSGFDASQHASLFIINTSVRTNVTYEALALVKEIVEQYSSTFTPADLTTTQEYYLKSNARRFETLSAKIGVLTNMAMLDLPKDYVQQRAKQVQALTVPEVQKLAQQHIHPDKLVYVVVGDAQTQLAGLSKLGLGEVVKLN
ncbi:M16 family metallopeptidase [Pseudoalteromonas pernae]|uniref:M16 family metallopeptidase n=1 Tax=Pseudoalteromonas pernae TaxID=3118054 RepID=UPI0032429C19